MAGRCLSCVLADVAPSPRINPRKNRGAGCRRGTAVTATLATPRERNWVCRMVEPKGGLSEGWAMPPDPAVRDFPLRGRDTCDECGGLLDLRRGRQRGRGPRFCSSRWYRHRNRGRHRARGTVVQAVCVSCGAGFEYVSSTKPRKYCVDCRKTNRDYELRGRPATRTVGRKPCRQPLGPSSSGSVR
jgi:hypothetical protein